VARAGAFLHAQLHAHPGRYDEILSGHLPRLLAAFGDAPPIWWFTRYRETARPDADQHLDLTLRLPQGAYGIAAEHARAWAERLHTLGLASGLVLATYHPQTGRFGHGAALEAAHQVFAADSAAALAQIRLAEQAGALFPQAVAAASALDLVTQLASDAAEAEEWLLSNLPQGKGRLDRALRNQALELATAEGRSALGDLPDGLRVAETWRARAEALNVYRHALARERHPLTVARSLVHQHHVRALGVSPNAEATTLRLVRNAALQHRRTSR
jgi:thiopeptide-type bacteriocin biosynthesis protein